MSLMVLQRDQVFHNEFNNLEAERIIGQWRDLKKLCWVGEFYLFLEMESLKVSAYIHIGV